MIDTSAQTQLAVPRRPHHLVLLGLLTALAAVVVTLLVSVQSAPSERPTAPSAVATSFLSAYAAHDPAACEFAGSELRDVLVRQDRCAGSAVRAHSTVTELFSRTCGDRHGFHAVVDPAGELQHDTVALSLQNVGERWQVVAIRPVSDRAVLVRYECDR